jgi:hypothetical protein
MGGLFYCLELTWQYNTIMNVQSILQTALTDKVLQTFATTLNISTDKATTLLGTLSPVLTGALANNAGTNNGAEALLTALKKDHDGSILDNVTEVFSQGGTTDSAKILGHIFGGKKESVIRNAAGALGESPQTIEQGLATLAPVLMGALGKVQKEQGFNVTDLLAMLKGTTESAGNTTVQSLLTSMLDSDNDGSIMDDVLTMGASALKNMWKR